MIRTTISGITTAALVALLHAAPAAAQTKVLSDKPVTGFGHPETVIYDPGAKVLYVSDFGAELKPADKDGKGHISRVGLDGKIIERDFLPPKGQTMNKPKGMWIEGQHLWVTDIDAVWEFDLGTKQGKKLDLPGAKFANDVAVLKGALYVSDNRADQLFRVEPPDFLAAKSEPKVSVAFSGKGVSPNGIYPAEDGSLLMVGFKGKDEPLGIFSMVPGQEPKPISDKIGMLDGLYQMKGGDILATDWVSGSLFHWSKAEGMQKLATGFKGPADFAVAPNDEGLLVVVPDLVEGNLRFVQLGK